MSVGGVHVRMVEDNGGCIHFCFFFFFWLCILGVLRLLFSLFGFRFWFLFDMDSWFMFRVKIYFFVLENHYWVVDFWFKLVCLLFCVNQGL